MSEHPREFVVQRSKWLRGDPMNSALLDEDGCRCCLGFVSSQCGVPDRHMLERATPSVILHSTEPVVGVLVQATARRKHTELARHAIPLNDSAMLTDDEREAKLAALFAEHGYALRFEP